MDRLSRHSNGYGEGSSWAIEKGRIFMGTSMNDVPGVAEGSSVTYDRAAEDMVFQYKVLLIITHDTCNRDADGIPLGVSLPEN